MLLRLARGSLFNRRAAVSLTVATIAISIALLVLVEQMRGQVREGFYRSVSGTDLIVGAPTSSVQLLLFSVFGIGQPARNIGFERYLELIDDPMVEWAVPISLGDTYRGVRVVATTGDFYRHYRYAGGQSLEFAHGRAPDKTFEAVLGARAAHGLGLALGDTMVLAHGGGNVSLHHHDDHPFEVIGVLAATGTPVDHSIYIPLAAQHELHRDWQQGVPPRRPAGGRVQSPADANLHAHEDAADAAKLPEEISAALLGLRTRAAALGMQYRINRAEGEPLYAILPGIALQELWRITALAEQILRVVAAMVVLAGLLGMLTALLSTLNERRREMAILRACGARPWQVSGLLLLEAVLIVIAGIAAGVVLAWAVLRLAAPMLLDRLGIAVGFNAFEPWQWLVLAVIAAAGVLVALVPAVMAYRRTLSDGMQVRL
ncbi:MAG: ABC transporter permease [Wenzhouxiangellaceae bacterium]